MVKGAIHPNGANFHRAARFDIVARTRRLCDTGLIRERPKWLEWCERVPPMEMHNLHMQARTVRNPYPRMLGYLLKKYPDLRFQDCYVDGNDWSVGNDVYRNDHPAMQFVARQLELMRTEGLSKKEAFTETENMFRGRREHLEREQKVMMAMMVQEGQNGLEPMFATGRAYLEQEKARNEVAHLNHIRKRLRDMKRQAKEAAAVKAVATTTERIVSDTAATRGDDAPRGDGSKETPPPQDMGFMRSRRRADLAKRTDAQFASLFAPPADAAVSADPIDAVTTPATPEDVGQTEEALPNLRASEDDHVARDDAAAADSDVEQRPARLDAAFQDDAARSYRDSLTEGVEMRVGRQAQKTAAQWGNMLKGSGGVQGEDMDYDDFEDAPSTRRKRRSRDRRWRDDDEDDKP